MGRKLTLNVDESLIDFAHQFARESHQSVSGIFEKYLKRLRDGYEGEFLTQETSALYGILEDHNLPDKKEMRAAFYEKSAD